MHRVHAAMRLEINAAGIEADALADEGQPACDATARTVTQPDDARRAVVVAARHGEESPGAESSQRALVVEAKSPALACGQRAQRAAVARGIELVRGKHRKPARKMVAFGFGGDRIEIEPSAGK